MGQQPEERKNLFSECEIKGSYEISEGIRKVKKE